jgi:hypothetical protein
MRSVVGAGGGAEGGKRKCYQAGPGPPAGATFRVDSVGGRGRIRRTIFIITFSFFHHTNVQGESFAHEGDKFPMCRGRS